MAGTANSITSHNSLRGVLNANNVIAGGVGTAFDSTYSIIAETGAQIALSISSTDYKMQATLKDKYGNIIYTSNIIDLPLETMVVNARYDKNTKEVVLILDNGNELRFSVVDLVEGLVSTDQLNSTLTDYVKNTDYATATKGGIVKTGAGLSLNTDGTTIADTKTYAQYNDSGNVLFIGKGTLENVITGKELVNKTYVDESDTVFEDKLFGDNNVEGSGTELTIDNTTKAPMSLVYKGNTYQDSTTGKQLFNMQDKTGTIDGVTWTAINGILKISGTNTNTTAHSGWSQVQDLPSFSIGEAYTIRAEGLAKGEYLQFIYYTGSAYKELVYIDSTNVYNFTIPDDFSRLQNIFLGIYGSATTLNNTIKLILVKGTYTNDNMPDFEPYTNGASPNPNYPQDIHTVSGDNEVVVCGKNLFNDSIKNNMWIDTAGVIDTSSIGANLVKIPCSSGDTFSLTATYETASGKGAILIAFFDSNNNMLSRNAQGILTTLSLTKTAPTNSAYVYAGHFIEEPTTIQLEKGEATTYEEYKGASYPISLGDIELCKIGTYQDKIFKNTPNTTDYVSNLEDNVWYVKKEIGSKLLTTSDYNNIFSNYSNLDYITIFKPNESANKGNSNDIPILYTKGIYTYTTNFNSLDNLNKITSSIGYDYFYLGVTKGITTEQAQNIVNGSLLYYPLATPTYTEITDSTLINQLEIIKKSYEGQTNITQVNNDMPFELNITAVSGNLSGLKFLLETKEDKSNKVAIVNKYSTDEEYPTAKCIYEIVGDIESVLEKLDIGNVIYTGGEPA